ncbi:hypothetical protein MAUB1S_01747 [Mycolicibacterium aubagnense]
MPDPHVGVRPAGRREHGGVTRGTRTMVVGAEKRDVAAGFGHSIALVEADVEVVERASKQVGRDGRRAVGDVPQ